VRRLDRADRIDVRADPVFGCGAVHVGGQTVAPIRYVLAIRK
jgi:hypothetical protein